MITISKRKIANFHRMVESDNYLIESKRQKKLGNLGIAQTLLKKSKELSKICREESMIFKAQDLIN